MSSNNLPIYKFTLTYEASYITDQVQPEDMDSDGWNAEFHAENIAKDLLKGLKKEVIAQLTQQFKQEIVYDGALGITSRNGNGGITVSVVNAAD